MYAKGENDNHKKDHNIGLIVSGSLIACITLIVIVILSYWYFTSKRHYNDQNAHKVFEENELKGIFRQRRTIKRTIDEINTQMNSVCTESCESKLKDYKDEFSSMQNVAANDNQWIMNQFETTISNYEKACSEAKAQLTECEGLYLIIKDDVINEIDLDGIGKIIAQGKMNKETKLFILKHIYDFNRNLNQTISKNNCTLFSPWKRLKELLEENDPNNILVGDDRYSTVRHYKPQKNPMEAKEWYNKLKNDITEFSISSTQPDICIDASLSS